MGAETNLDNVNTNHYGMQVSTRKQKQPSKTTACRLSPEITEKLDKYVEKQRKLTGFKITRANVVARFVERGLAAEEKK